jgi:hypothetical protein
MFGLSQLYIVNNRVVTFQKSVMGVSLDASSIVDAVRSAASQASHIVASHTFSGVSYTSATTTIVFELPAIDASGDTIANTYDYVSIYTSGADVYRITDAASGSARLSGTKQLADVLDGISFTYDVASFPSVASVTVDATTTSIVRGQTTQAHLREHIYLRNL